MATISGIVDDFRTCSDTAPVRLDPAIGKVLVELVVVTERELDAPLVVNASAITTVDYGRVLAYVYRAADGIFVNYEMVRQGYAQPLTIPPNVAYSERFVEAARGAEADDAGLWGGCS